MEDLPSEELERMLQDCEAQTLTHLQAYKEYTDAEDRKIIAERIMIIENQIGFIKSLLDRRHIVGKN
jgi:hypothetical protein